MSKRNISIILIIGAVLLLAILSFWFFKKRATTPGAAPTQAQLTAEKKQQALQGLTQALNAMRVKDQDVDGLSDQDETQKYHTDPKKADTDGDGLLDRDEIFIYKTDPLKRDSYGIGHSDGWGVRNRVILPGGKVDKAQLKKLTT